MKTNTLRFVVSTFTLTACLTTLSATSAHAQHAAALTKDKNGNIQLQALTSTDLKAAIAEAVTSGDIAAKDGNELIEKIKDIEILMDQFDFIRDQQRRLIGSYGSVIH